jgi:hypothetical protein
MVFELDFLSKPKPNRQSPASSQSFTWPPWICGTSRRSKTKRK